MGARRIWGVAAAAAVALAAATVGCQPKPVASPTGEGQLAQDNPPAATQPADAGSAEALARKAEEWARILETLRAKRDAAATQPVVIEDATPKPAELATSQPAEATVEKPQPGSALVFDPPAPTPPMIQVSPPVAPTTQAIKPPVEPKVIVRDVLVERVQAGVKNAPRDAAANLEYQLVRFLNDEQAPDLAALSELPAEDREAISAVLDGLSNFRAVLRGDPNGMVSRKVRPLVEMGDRLRAQGDLQIGGTALCAAVRGYGVYEPLKGAFVEGRENKALLYCEVNGFASRLGEGGMWETTLTEEVVLYRGETEVWRKGKVDEIIDRCRNRRRDFYTMNLIVLPATLPPGSYTLKVTVIDQVASRVAEGLVPVTIAGAGMASGK